MGNYNRNQDRAIGRVKAFGRRYSGRRAVPIVAIISLLGVGTWAAVATASSNLRGSQSTNDDTSQTIEDTTMDTQPSDNSSNTPQEQIVDRGDGSTTEVMVNGESVTVPENGSYQRTSRDGNGTTDVKIESQNQQSSSGDGRSNSSSSKIEVNVESHSQSGG